LTGAREDLAVANLDVFLTAVRERRSDALAGDPVRAPEADRDGRYGWRVPTSDGLVIMVLMPGAELDRVRALSATAPCLFVNGAAWWWNDAVGLFAATALWSISPRPASRVDAGAAPRPTG
jgi:hypothetical protein